MNPTSRTYRFIAFSLAFLMFSTSASFAVDMHFCQGKVKSFSIFGKAKNCYDMAVNKDCPNHQKMAQQNEGCSSMAQKQCCHNSTLQVQPDQNQQVQSLDFSLNKPLQHFVAAYVFIFFKNTFSVENDAPSFANYIPPIISRDIPVLFETFLI
ncbi:MAG TPA: hypothetical protein ENJ95_09420 [Bacteroidetes bacterium]|nr:hypothetical protein [Bacteroidota bacterium]